MSLTAEQAIAQLNQVTTEEGFMDLVRQISIETPADVNPNATTLLYSGKLGGDSNLPSIHTVIKYVSNIKIYLI